MKNKLLSSICLLVLLFVTDCLFAQKSKNRSFTGGRFMLDIAGHNVGYLKPVVKKDTLIYTVNDLRDSAIIRTKCDSIFRKINQQYYIQYKLKRG